MDGIFKNSAQGATEPSLQGLISWLESEIRIHGPEEPYHFWNFWGPCLLARYGMFLWPALDRLAATTVVEKGIRKQLRTAQGGSSWGNAKAAHIFASRPYTLGAALIRARAVFAEYEAVTHDNVVAFAEQVRACKTVTERPDSVALRDEIVVFVRQIRTA